MKMFILSVEWTDLFLMKSFFLLSGSVQQSSWFDRLLRKERERRQRVRRFAAGRRRHISRLRNSSKLDHFYNEI